MKRFASFTGIDRAIFITLLGRGWNVGAGLLTIFLVAHFLTQEMQGYYYTFNSLIALQIFAELGLNFALIQFASHEMAELTWQADGTVSGSLTAKRRLQSLLKFAYTWFGVAALLMVVLLMPAGLYFFGVDSITEFQQSKIAIPWLCLVFITAINLFIIASLAVLEGCGRVSIIASLRLFQSVFSVTAVAITLILGGELFALVANSLTMLLIGLSFLIIRFRHFFYDLLIKQSSDLSGMSWKHEIWPFQWRIAVSWMSGYFIFQIFNPLLFKTQGPIAAGQMGMSLQIIMAMNGVAMVWITTKVPLFGQLIAKKQFGQLNALFKSSLIQSSIFLLISVSCVLAGVYGLNYISSQYAIRLLPVTLFSILCVVCLINHIVFAEASYLRAFKKEPFMILSVLGGIATSGLAFLWIPNLGLEGAVYAYSLPAAFIGLIGGTIIFFLKKKEWAK